MARYQNYRGRQPIGTRVAIVLLILMLIAACTFIFAQQHVSYADDGRIYLDVPYFGRFYLSAPARPAEPEGDVEPEEPPVHLVVDEPEDTPEPEEPPAPVDTFGVHRVMELSARPAGGMELASLLQETGCNGFVFTVRDNTGRVFWNSPTAQTKSVSADEAATEALRGLCEGEDILAVARFNVLHDSYFAAANMRDAAICRSNGYVWYDNHSYHWLDADKEMARQYVTGLAVECAELGFDELLLEELSYPTRGNTYKIDYSGNTMEKNEALALLLTEMKAALEPYGTKLSLLLTEEQILEDGSADSGVDMAMLLPLVDGVYVQAADQEAVRAALEAVPGESPAVVYLTAEPAEEENWCIPAG